MDLKCNFVKEEPYHHHEKHIFIPKLEFSSYFLSYTLPTEIVGPIDFLSLQKNRLILEICKLKFFLFMSVKGIEILQKMSPKKKDSINF